jgi:hypothetical protein|tara:strand:+ start:1407 stop:2159 length:753 start_codon:yes stop_codon:yes gene_type:complete
MSKHNNKNCLICCEAIVGHYILLHKTRRQSHILCEDCSEGYLKPIFEQITKNLRNKIYINVTSIKCPGSYCGESRNMCRYEIDIFKIKIPDIFSIYTDYFRIHYLLTDQNSFVCFNSNCGQLMVQHPHDYNCDITCLTCNQNWCKNCNVSPYHYGKCCIQLKLEQNNTDEAKYINSKILSGDIKLCPGCSIPIEKEKKVDGSYVACNKIICSVCGIKWCWLCLDINIDYEHYNVNSLTRCADKLWDGVNI